MGRGVEEPATYVSPNVCYDQERAKEVESNMNRKINVFLARKGVHVLVIQHHMNPLKTEDINAFLLFFSPCEQNKSNELWGTQAPILGPCLLISNVMFQRQLPHPAAPIQEIFGGNQVFKVCPATLDTGRKR